MTRLTPDQHRRMAEIYREPDKQATLEERKHKEALAKQHETLAKMIEHRDAEKTKPKSS